MDLFDVYSLFKIEPVRGKGCYVYDEHGKAYLDLYGGHAVISIGHGHPTFVRRISEQLSRLPFYSNSVQNSLQQHLADKLAELSGCDSYQLFLCSSGAEANENALKLASFQTGRKKVVGFKGGFHGRTSAAVNITDNPKIKAPINEGFKVNLCELNAIDEVRKELRRKNVCAVIIEGIQGIGGIYVPEASFLQDLQALCRQYDTPLILDEIQSGYGRSGQFFAFQHAGIEPDLITMAKGMGNGFPIGGVLIHPKFKAAKGLLGTTFGGNHLACAAGIAVLEVIKGENLIKHVGRAGQFFMDELKKIPTVRKLRGHGLMIGLEFDFEVANLRQRLLYEEHVFTGSAADKNTLRLLPPLTVDNEEISVFIEKLKRVLESL